MRGRVVAGAIYLTAVAAIFAVALARLEENLHSTGSARSAPAMPTAMASPKPVALTPSVSPFAEEQSMSPGQLMQRWDPEIAQAAKRFDVPVSWIRAVMQVESGGRTMLNETTPTTSRAGAGGLMQLMPATYEDIRRTYGLGLDRFDPHDNILAGAAYLAWLREKYGYPALFAAYNDGPGHLDERLARAQLLPLETRSYLVNVTAAIANRGRGTGLARLTRPNGSTVLIDAGLVSSIRSALPDEYPACVQAVIAVGKLKQGVCETVADAKAAIRAHGGGV